jgi:hypothetical protein
MVFGTKAPGGMRMGVTSRGEGVAARVAAIKAETHCSKGFRR